MTTLVGLWPWPLTPFWHLETGAQCSTCDGVPSCQFWWYDYSFSIYGSLGQHGSDWSHDLVTLTFDLGSHGISSWCGSSSFIRVPSLKFVGLANQKIWRMMCVSIIGPRDLDHWPFDLETGMRWGLGNLPSKFELFATHATDGRTDKKQHLWPPSQWAWV